MSPAQVSRVRRYKSATQSKGWVSFGVSTFLHLGLLFAIVFMPERAPVKINLDAPIMILRQVTIGATGEKTSAIPQPAESAPPPAPVDTVIEAVPVPKLEDLAKELEKTPPVQEVPVPKLEEDPKDPEEIAPEKTVPTDEELLAAALAGAKSDAKAAPKVSGGQSLLDSALSSAGKDAKAEKVISGKGGDGIGIAGTYADSIISRVRPHFTTRPRTDGQVYVVLVLLEIGADGRLIKATIKEKSGDDVLDANVLKAIRLAGKFEAPPNLELRKIEIPFTSDIYAGR